MTAQLNLLTTRFVFVCFCVCRKSESERELNEDPIDSSDEIFTIDDNDDLDDSGNDCDFDVDIIVDNKRRNVERRTKISNANMAQFESINQGIFERDPPRLLETQIKRIINNSDNSNCNNNKGFPDWHYHVLEKECLTSKEFYQSFDDHVEYFKIENYNKNNNNNNSNRKNKNKSRNEKKSKSKQSNKRSSKNTKQNKNNSKDRSKNKNKKNNNKKKKMKHDNSDSDESDESDESDSSELNELGCYLHYKNGKDRNFHNNLINVISNDGQFRMFNQQIIVMKTRLMIL